jgi:glycosyltransferase involved in cell wall biosynthesis
MKAEVVGEIGYMKKILFYINAIHYGGAERVIVNLANEFSQNGYKVILVTSFRDKEEYPLEKTVHRLSLEENELMQNSLKKNISRIADLRRICKREEPDIVVSFMAEANFRALLATMLLGIKTVISVRNDPQREYPNFAYKAAAALLYPFASGCVFQTEDARKYFSKATRKKSKIILNQVDKKFYEIKYEGVRKDIVTVGRLEKQKNHRLLMDAFAKIAGDFPKDNLLIYGDGSLRQSLTGYAQSLGLENRIILKGISRDIQETIKDAKLFVLSSDFEGLPNTVMEAMTLGIPVISTDCPCGGPRMLIEDQKNGILVPVKDACKMAEAMKSVMEDREFAGKLSRSAKERSLDFSPEKVFCEWEQYILSVCR